MKAADMEAKEGLLLRQEITHDDHPLSLGTTSVWHQFFQVSIYGYGNCKQILETEPVHSISIPSLVPFPLI